MTKINNVDNDVMTIAVDMDLVKTRTDRTFSQDTSTAWDPNPEYNAMFLKAQQQYANDIVLVRGHLFLNEVYDALGLSRTDIGAIVGWRKKPEGWVTFGIDKPIADPSIRLEFNIDGPILDLL